VIQSFLVDLLNPLSKARDDEHGGIKIWTFASPAPGRGCRGLSLPFRVITSLAWSPPSLLHDYMASCDLDMPEA
jgi:hypothetical protein